MPHMSNGERSAYFRACLPDYRGRSSVTFFGSWTNAPGADEYANATFVPCNAGDILTEALAGISQGKHTLCNGAVAVE